jgi:branched-chain amino acid transport system permease protein
MGGIVYVLPSAVVPSSYTTSLTFFLWTILLLGGASTIFGPSLGAVLFWMVMALLGNLLPQLAAEGILPMSDIQAGTLRYILVGVSLMLLVIFRPQGILGDKREMTFVK